MRALCLIVCALGAVAFAVGTWIMGMYILTGWHITDPSSWNFWKHWSMISLTVVFFSELLHKYSLHRQSSG